MKRYGKIFEVTETVRLPKNLHSIEDISNIILEEIFNCKTKEEYVKKVYESMNKGAGGGFEF